MGTTLVINVHVLVYIVERVATHCGHRLFVGIGNGSLRAPIGPRAWSDDPLVDDGHRVDAFVGRGVQFTLLLTIVVVCVGPGWSRLFTSIADCFDFVGFTLLACFNKYVAAIEHPTQRAAWIGCFQITTACSVIAMIAQSFAVFFEAKKRRERTSTTQHTIGS